jgi:asparagine synthase (glutamine-hydrolysing)
MPESLRLQDGTREKQVLVEAFASRLPPRIAARRKQPYRAPGVGSFRGRRAAERLAALLHPDRVRDIGLFHPGRLAQFLTRIAGAGMAVSPREEMAFVALVSTAELYESFIRNPPRATFPEHRVTVASDHRQTARAGAAQ